MLGEQAPPAYTTNASLEEIADWLRGLSSLVVLTHAKPDGDAMGASLGLVRAMNLSRGGTAKGVSGAASVAEAWYAGAVPFWARAIVRQTKHRLLEPPAEGEPRRTAPSSLDPDGIVIVDTGAWGQLADFAEFLRPRTARAVVIDHHLAGDADVAARRYVDTSAAAACEIVAELCRILLGVRKLTDLPADVAEPLYLGICTDTGWFRHSNVSPRVMRVAADLLETGVKPGPLYETVEQGDRPERLKLLRRALDSLEFHDDDRFVVMTLRRQDFTETGAAPGDSGGFHEIVKTVATVRVSVLLTETPGDDGRPVTKVSMRSKSAVAGAAPGDGLIDVNEISRTLGGGGHRQAAGARVNADAETTKRLVLDALRRAAGLSS